MDAKSGEESPKKNWNRRPANYVPLSVSKMVRFTPNDIELLNRASTAKGLSVAALIRLAIFDYLKEEGYERT